MSSSSRPTSANTSRPGSRQNNANKVYPQVIDELKSKNKRDAFEMEEAKKAPPAGPSQEEEQRESWGGKLDFFLSALSYSGLLNSL